MAVTNGQRADQDTFNDAFVSRTQDSNTTGRIDLENADAASGASVTNAQKSLNGQASFTGSDPNGTFDQKPTWDDDTIGVANENVKDRVDAVQANLQSNNTETTSLRTLTGTTAGQDDLGTFTGSTVSDNTTVKAGMQELETEVEAKIDSSEKGAANGVATLDGAGKIPTSQLPTDVMTFEGMWNASTNTPTLSDGTGTNGQKYIVSVAGSQDLGSGSISFDAGDALIHDGSVWNKLDTVDQVTSVNGEVGAVVLDTDDIAEGVTNEYYTDTKVDARIAAASIDDLSDVDTTTTAPAIDEVLKWDGSNWIPGEGGGSGQGGINFVTNPSAETDTSDWGGYDDTTSDPVDGTGGSLSALTFTRTTSASELLRGEGTFKLSSSADATGEGVSTPFTIDPKDKNKQLYVSLDYKNSAALASNIIRVFVYDVTNAAIINVENDDDGNILSHSGDGTSFTGVFTATDSTSYRLLIHVTATNANFDFFFDNVKVSPEVLVPGAIITEWKSDTVTFGATGTAPTKGGSITNDKISWRRNGSNLEVVMTYRQGTAGTAGSGTYLIAIPDGLTADTDVVPFGTGIAEGVVGAASASGNDGNASGVVLLNDANNLKMAIGRSAQDPIPASSTWQELSNAAQLYSFEASIPIQGWSSGAAVGTNELALQTIRFRGYRGSTQVVNNNVVGDIDIDTVDFDSHNALSAGGGFEAPSSRFYFVTGSISYDGAASATTLQARLAVDGTLKSITNDSKAAGDRRLAVTDIIYMEKGEELILEFFQNSAGNLDVNSGVFETHLSVTSLPDFSVFTDSGFRTDGKSSVVVPGTKEVQVMSAMISYSGGTPSIGFEVGDWISSLTDVGVGDVDINFNSGVVSNNNITVTAIAEGGNITNLVMTHVFDPTTSKLRLRCYKGNTGSLTDPDRFWVHVMAEV